MEYPYRAVSGWWQEDPGKGLNSRGGLRAISMFWGRATAQQLGDLFADGFHLCEQKQIIRAAGLRVRSRHVEAAKWMCTHNGSGALAVDVEIAHVELALGQRNLFR